jgi:serine/threonine protein kinase
MLELNLQRAVLKDRYEIRGRISSGSYAEVFVARDRDSGNAVVIKALNSRLQGIPPPELEQMLGEKFQGESAILNKIRRESAVSEDEPTGKFAPSETLKKLYRDLAKLVHPDKFPDGAEKARHDILMARVSSVA